MSYRRIVSTFTATAIATLLVGCGGATPASIPPAGTGSASPASAPSSAPTLLAAPPLSDVPFYKADTARSGVHPGPAPTSTPVEVWRAEIGCALGARTGVIGSGLLITGCDDAKIVALDATTGAPRWTTTLDGPSLGSPAIADGAVYVADSAGAFTSLDLSTGSTRWSVPIPAIRHPVVVGDTAYVGTSDGRFLGVSTTDGSITWSWQAPAGVGEAAGTVLDDAAYIGTDQGILHVVSLADRTERWQRRIISGGVSTPAISSDAVFVASLQTGEEPLGELYALDRATGGDRWRFRTVSGEQVAPPTVVDGTVVSPSSSDGLFAFDAVKGTVRWQAPTGPMSGQAPAIVGDTIVLAMDRSVGAFSRTDGTKLWEVDLDADLDNSPIVSGGMVFVADNAGVIRALAEPSLAALLRKASASQEPQANASPAAVIELVATFDATTSGLDQPSGMDVGPDGNLYVVNALASEVLVLDPDGSVVRRWGSKGGDPGAFNFLRDVSDLGSAIGGVAVGVDGTVYVADTVNRRVQQFDADGTFIRQWGRFGERDGQFLEPIDLDVGPDGSVYVVDDQRDDIQRFTADGTFVAVIGEHGTGPGQLNFTGAVTVGPDGTLLNADWDNHRVQAWDASGAFLWTIGTRGSLPGDFELPSDVAIDDAGRFHVADRGGIQTFDADRHVLGSWSADGSDAYGLAYADGTLYLSDRFGDKIRKFRLLD